MFSAFLAWLGGLMGGPFAKAAVEMYRSRLASENNSELIAANLAAQHQEINRQRDALAAQVVTAEQGHWYTAAVRPLFALPFVVFNLKVVVWDKVLSLGVTDPLSRDMLNLESVIVAGYFGSIAIENATRIFSRRK